MTLQIKITLLHKVLLRGGAGQNRQEHLCVSWQRHHSHPSYTHAARRSHVSGPDQADAGPGLVAAVLSASEQRLSPVN